ncbi:MAG: tetratricopeptide repeat protein [Acidobacteria bacterium]|nr:tetratricopeptide repeat protein [Acidobacteriota bacterium]
MAADSVLVMPFENRSQLGEYNWIRESFVILLADVLNMPEMAVIDAAERNIAYDKLRLSPNDLLTRAAMIRIAETAQANLALIGEFDIGRDAQNTTISIAARLIETREGRLVGNRVFNFSGPLSELQDMQGQLAWNLLYVRNPSFPYSKELLVRKATSTPPRAYESYVKGIQTQDPKLREGFLRRAMQEYESDGKGSHFPQAVYELAIINYRQSNFAEAVKLLKELKKDDPNYSEGLFYLGLAAYYAGDQTEASTALLRLAESMPMLEVLNNAGAVMLAKGDLANALQLLRRALANSPNDALYRFNYGYALWRNHNYEEAAQHLRFVVKANLRDGEAQFLLAKCLQAMGQQAEATQADNEAKRNLGNYARWTVAPDRMPLLARLKPELNRQAFYKIERQQRDAQKTTPPPQLSQRQLLDRARQLIILNNNDVAMTEIQRVLSFESNNSEAHYLRAVVLSRRGEMEGAISALQAAVSYNPKLIEGHISLGRLYLARGDRALAMAHSRQALEIDPQNRDAIALKQQIETGR